MIEPSAIYDEEAERSVLGALLLSTSAMADVLEEVTASDFYYPKHEQIFLTIHDLYQRGEPCDPITIAAALSERGALEKAGGGLYLHELARDVPSAASAGFYARIVQRKARLRHIREAATRVLQAVENAELDDVERLANEAQEVFYAATERRGSKPYVALGDALEQALERIETHASGGEAHGLSTGFRELDRLTGGLRGGQMIVVAGRPSLGKSTLGLDLARAAAITQTAPTVYFTLEMDTGSVTTRLLSAEANVPLTALDRGNLNHDQWRLLADAAARLARAPLFIDDTAQLTLASLRSKCRKIKHQYGLGLIVIDYLQLLESPRRPESRQAEVAELSRGLKLLAKELAAPVVAMSQLNRGVETRADRRPLLADMRESGAIEQDADLVLFVHRDEAYDRDLRPGEADLIVAKNRQGPTGTATVAFQSMYARFADMPQENL